MNIRFLRIFTFLMCAFTTGIVNARTLHVGNKSFALSQTKYTTPSLAFGIGNETWYAPMTRIFINNSLHLKVDSITYSVINCAEGFVDAENYTYDENGRLIGADERLWLKSDGGSYVDTGFIADNASRIYAKIYNDRTSWFFCSRQGQQNQSFGFLWTAGDTIRTDYGKSLAENIKATSGIYIIDKNKNVTTYTHPNGQTYTLTQNTQNFITPHTMLLMAYYSTTNGGIAPANKFDHQRHYYFKIWDDGVLVRDMVPVPACMRIGDFVVPENGMWDIVEQKFYGNSGTGSFIYGRDE